MSGMEKNVDPLLSGSGSTEIQIARPIPDIGASSPTVSCMAAISTKGVPGLDQFQSFAVVCFRDIHRAAPAHSARSVHRTTPQATQSSSRALVPLR